MTTPRTATALALAFALAAVHCGGGDDGGSTGDGANGAPSADVAPAVKDNSPGTLVITSPARAAFIAAKGATPVDVTGTGGHAGLTVNGAPADVAADGSFHATVTPTVGLNVVVVADPQGSVATSFLYGDFHPVTEAIPRGVAVDIAAAGMNGSGTTVTTLVNATLADKDLLGSVRGQTFHGSGPAGSSWSFHVSGTHYARAQATLGPRTGGANVSASMGQVVVNGTLSVHELFVTVSHGVTMTADAARVAGALDLSVNRGSGAVGATMPSPSTSLAGFRYDSNNFGFPCCIDSAVTGFLRPRVEAAFRNGVREKTSQAMELTLASLHLPSQVAVPLMPPVALDARFDGGEFDTKGARLTSQVRFGKAFDKAQPGAAAPGWIHLDGSLANPTFASPYGVTVAIDAINQLLFASWGAGGLARDLAAPNAPLADAHVSAALPPVVTPTPDGALTLGLGEITVKADLDGKPVTVAATVVQTVAPDVKGENLVLTPKGAPTVTITWFDAAGLPDAARTFVVSAAQDELAQAMKPIAIPLPKIAAGRVASAYAGKSFGLGDAASSVRADQARVELRGKLVVVP